MGSRRADGRRLQLSGAIGWFPLAEEQAALWHVATLVALAAPPDEVFVAVTVDVVRLHSVAEIPHARGAVSDHLPCVVEPDQRRPVARLPAAGSETLKPVVGVVLAIEGCHQIAVFEDHVRHVDARYRA